MTDTTNITLAHCSQCLGETRHSVVAARTRNGFEDQLTGWWENTRYEMLECCGCGNITMRSTDMDAAATERSVTYFPPAVTRRRPTWLYDFLLVSRNRNVYELFAEVYAALHAGSNRLAMMGARTLIDAVMLDKIGDKGTFAQRLERMETDGHISRTNRKYLEAAIDAGSAAAHRGHRPADEDVNRVIDIVENLVQGVYVLHSASEALRQNTPPRPSN